MALQQRLSKKGFAISDKSDLNEDSEGSFRTEMSESDGGSVDEL